MSPFCIDTFKGCGNVNVIESIFVYFVYYGHNVGAEITKPLLFISQENITPLASSITQKLLPPTNAAPPDVTDDPLKYRSNVLGEHIVGVAGCV